MLTRLSPGRDRHALCHSCRTGRREIGGVLLSPSLTCVQPCSIFQPYTDQVRVVCSRLPRLACQHHLDRIFVDCSLSDTGEVSGGLSADDLGFLRYLIADSGH